MLCFVQVWDVETLASGGELAGLASSVCLLWLVEILLAYDPSLLCASQATWE